MKKFFIIMALPVIFMGITITSCKKKTKDPDYPQLVGSWKGTTSQSIPIQIDVANSGGTLYVTLVNLKFSAGPGDTTTIYRYNSDGLSALSGTSFTVILEGTAPKQSYVTGTFRTDSLVLNGGFTGYSNYSAAFPVTGIYTARKSK